jgi:hypothetical protein
MAGPPKMKRRPPAFVAAQAFQDFLVEGLTELWQHLFRFAVGLAGTSGLGTLGGYRPVSPGIIYSAVAARDVVLAVHVEEELTKVTRTLG